MHVSWRPLWGGQQLSRPGWSHPQCRPLLPGEAKEHLPYRALPLLCWIHLAYLVYVFRLDSSTTNQVECAGYGVSPRAALQTPCRTIKIIIQQATVHLRHETSITWEVPTWSTKGSCKSGHQTFKTKCTKAYKGVFLQSRATFKSCQVPKSAPTQGCQLCHGCLCWSCTQVRNDQ